MANEPKQLTEDELAQKYGTRSASSASTLSEDDLANKYGAGEQSEIPDAAAQAHAASVRPLTEAAKKQDTAGKAWAAGLGGAVHAAGESLAHLAEESQNERLHHIAHGEQDTGSGALADLGARTFRTAENLITPKSLGIMGAAAVAPEIVGPALMAHGGVGMLEHGKGAYHELVGPGRLIDIGGGNQEPHEAEPGAESGAFLSSASETAGGAAATGAGVKSWGTETPSPVGRLVRFGKQVTGNARLSPIEASTAAPAAEFQPALKNTPAEVLAHAQKEGIQLTPGQATQMPVEKMVQAIGERSLAGSKDLTEGIDRNAAALMKSVSEFARRQDPQALGTSAESAGEAIRQDAQTAKDVAHENASNAYKQLPKFDVDPTSIRAAWINARGGMPVGVEDAILAKVPRDMRAHVAEILEPSGIHDLKLTSDQAIGLRSLFLDLGRTIGAELPTRAQGIFKQMSQAADQALEQGSSKLGVDREWRDANQGWKDYVGKYGEQQSPLFRILEQKDPKAITQDLLSRRSAADVETLQKENMQGAVQALRRQVIEDVARGKFRVGKNGLGGYPDAFLNQLFGKEGLKELYLKADIGRRFNFEMNPSGTSNVMVAEHQITHPTPSRLSLLYGASKFARPRDPMEFLPEHMYRVRQAGNPTINPAGHSHATLTLEDAQRLMPGRASLSPAVGGGPQEIVRLPFARFAPQDFTIHPHEGSPWIQLHRQTTPEDYLPLEPEAPSRRLPAIGAAASEANARRRLPRAAGRAQ